jgi:hypothetical protein
MPQPSLACRKFQAELQEFLLDLLRLWQKLLRMKHSLQQLQ